MCENPLFYFSVRDSQRLLGPVPLNRQHNIKVDIAQRDPHGAPTTTRPATVIALRQLVAKRLHCEYGCRLQPVCADNDNDIDIFDGLYRGSPGVGSVEE